MIKKIITLLLIIIVGFAAAGLFAANYIFDKYLARPEVIEELVNGISQDLKGLEINHINVELIKENELKKTLLPTIKGNSLDKTQEKKADKEEEIRTQKKYMEDIDKRQNMDNNVKRLNGKIRINPADKARVIQILKSSLTSGDIQELEKIAVSRPLTPEKIARAKAILKARLTKQQKTELKMIYRKYYS